MTNITRCVRQIWIYKLTLGQPCKSFSHRNKVDFFDGEWNHIGSKDSRAYSIWETTGISICVLREDLPLWKVTIAERMSWAASRTATRSEDIAYSLMGIFDINIPLLYGEGRKAFIRLQEEILSRTTDPTFLLWGLESTTHSLFACSPGDFGDFRMQKLYSMPSVSLGLTNMGLEIETTLVRWDLQTYGLLVSRKESGYYFLLIQKHPQLDAM